MSSPLTTPRGSTAHTPDLGWSQVRETVLLLELAAGQIKAAMTESASSVDVLTAAFTGMAQTMRAIDTALVAGPAAAEDGSAARLRLAASEVSEVVQRAIVAFQFYDKLAQRLAHVTASLGDLSLLVADRGRIYDPQSWVQLQESIRSRYSTADERAMFAAVMNGVPVEEALQEYARAIRAPAQPDAGDIEFF